MISFLAGVGSGKALSLSPSKPLSSLATLYYLIAVRSIQQDSEAYGTYQAFGKNSELLFRR